MSSLVDRLSQFTTMELLNEIERREEAFMDEAEQQFQNSFDEHGDLR